MVVLVPEKVVFRKMGFLKCTNDGMKLLKSYGVMLVS